MLNDGLLYFIVLARRVFGFRRRSSSLTTYLVANVTDIITYHSNDLVLQVPSCPRMPSSSNLSQLH
jgi:hypothetical protein